MEGVEMLAVGTIVLLLAVIAFYYRTKLEKMKKCEHQYKYFRVCEFCGHRQRGKQDGRRDKIKEGIFGEKSKSNNSIGDMPCSPDIRTVPSTDLRKPSK